MADFANIEASKVITVIVADQAYVDTLDGTWVETDTHTKRGKHWAEDNQAEDSGTPLRKNYAMEGGLYDSVRDAFYEVQPYASWTLDESTCIWEPPVVYPDDGKEYTWDEATTNWAEVV